MDPNQKQPLGQQTPKQQVVESVREATNVLVTVKANPNVDELASVIGLTLMLNKMGKHATAVFSGEVPSTLEFLKPEETIETNTDSLRDFIISLDKSKADKLRYKVEDNVVRIYITPYRTSITDKDLEFAQGDFNIDAVIALGVTQRDELDNVITAHGKILHDATFITITAGQDHTEIGQVNWQEGAASSLSEMLVSISEALGTGLIDDQIATAFLTGIVAETERFSNPKTTPKVMTMSAQLMASGANQQLIANELEKTVEVDVSHQPESLDLSKEAAPDTNQNSSDTGVLSIDHNEEEKKLDDQLSAGHELHSEQAAPPSGVDLAEILKSPSIDTQAEDSPEIKPPSEMPGSKFLVNKVKPPEEEAVNLLEPEKEDQPAAIEQEEKQPSVFNSLKEMEASIDEPQPVLPPLESEPEDADQIQIDEHGNMMRKSAAEPKHKSVQPLSHSDEYDGGVLPPVDTGIDTVPAEGGFPPAPALNIDPVPEVNDSTTLLDLEKSVNSPHLDAAGIDAPPTAAPVDQTSFDAYRLPGNENPAGNVTDVTGNLPGDGQQTDEGDSMSPPPVPPPIYGN